MSDTVLLCTRQLALKADAAGYVLLDKTDWSQVGRISLAPDGAVLWLEIIPERRGQGLGSAAFRRLHDEQPSCAPAQIDIHHQWLLKMGYRAVDRHLQWPGALPPEKTADNDAALAALAKELHIPDNYGVQHQLPQFSEPEVLVQVGYDVFDRQLFLEPATAQSWQEMAAAAASDGVQLQPVSGFRSIGYQCNLIRRKLLAGQNPEQIYAVIAAPGYSEHHSGRALDVTCPGAEPLEHAFANTPAFDWLERRAREFGFALSYPADNRHGLEFEPWHWAHQV